MGQNAAPLGLLSLINVLQIPSVASTNDATVVYVWLGLDKLDLRANMMEIVHTTKSVKMLFAPMQAILLGYLTIDYFTASRG